MLEPVDQIGILAQDPEVEENEDGESELGEGCIEGMRCPECGNTDHFRIDGTSCFDVMSDGTDGFGDVEWDQSSSCVCPSCQFVGEVLDFTPEKKAAMDALVESLKQNGIAEDSLDALVDAVFSKKATEVNNEGLEAQVRFLAHQLGMKPFMAEMGLHD